MYSGGKFLRGPQTSGLLAGRKNLVHGGLAQCLPAPGAGPADESFEGGRGRPAGGGALVRGRDHPGEHQRWRDDLAIVAHALEGVAQTSVIEPQGVEEVPLLRVTWPAAAGIDAPTVRQRLLEGSPRIMLDDMSAVGTSVAIDPFSLQPGEAAEVGAALARALQTPRPTDSRAPEVTVAGKWDLLVRFLDGGTVTSLPSPSRAATSSGQHLAKDFAGPLTGTVDEDIRFGMVLRYEGTNIAFRFDGRLDGPTMAGEVALGSSTYHHSGAVNLAQFGTASWRATPA